MRMDTDLSSSTQRSGSSVPWMIALIVTATLVVASLQLPINAQRRSQLDAWRAVDDDLRRRDRAAERRLQELHYRLSQRDNRDGPVPTSVRLSDLKLYAPEGRLGRVGNRRWAWHGSDNSIVELTGDNGDWTGTYPISDTRSRNPFPSPPTYHDLVVGVRRLLYCAGYIVGGVTLLLVVMAGRFRQLREDRPLLLMLVAALLCSTALASFGPQYLGAFRRVFDEDAPIPGVAMLAMALALLIASYRPERTADGAPKCKTCRYNLTGNSSGLCPECGTPIPASAPKDKLI